MYRAIVLALVVGVAGFLTGCASQGERVATNVEAVQTHDFNPTDLQLLADKAVKDLLDKHGDVFPKDRKPFVYEANVKNTTDEHINSQVIYDRITAQLSDSGKVRISAVPQEIEEQVRALEHQQSAFVDPATRKQIGKMVASDFMIQASITNLQSEAGWKKGQYFQFTLQMVDIQTGEKWVSQVSVQKLSKRGLFGW